MKNRDNGNIIRLGIVIFLVALLQLANAQTVNIYVSPNGSSTGTGATSAAPVTFIQAKVVAKANPNNPCIVWLLDGNYGATRLVLDATDSRTVNAPLTIKALNPKKAVFQPLTLLNRAAFQQIPDSIKTRVIDNVAKTKVVQLNLSSYNLQNMNVWPNGFETGTVSWPVIYIDSVPLKMSQYPNDTVMRIRTVLTNGTNRSVPGGSFKYRDDRGKFWDKAVRDGLWLRGNWRVAWQITYLKTLSLTTADSTIVHAVGINNGIGDKYTLPAGNGKEPYVAVNLLEEIDREGEWSINFSTKMLYIWPPATGQLAVASDYTAIPISLTNVNNVSIENIAIKSGVADGVKLTNCNNVTVAGMDISYISGNAIIVNGGTNCTIKSNNLYELGEGGVIVEPTSAAALYTAQLSLTPSNHKVLNNHIYNFAKDVQIYSAAINLKKVIGNYVANNKIHGTPHVGILYDGNNNVLEYNELYDIIRTYDDMGAFYRVSSPKARGNKIRYNYIHDSPLSKGTFFDDESSGDSSSYNIDANNLYGLQNNGGYFNTYTNSIVINNNPATNIRVTIDTDPAFQPLYDSLKSIYNASATYRAAYPEVADMVANTTINKTYSSRIWPRLTCNVFISNTQVIRSVSDASLFNSNGTTNATYAQTQHPFTSHRSVVANNIKLSGVLVKPVKPFLIDSLKNTSAFAKTCSTDWRLNRIGLYTDEHRTVLNTDEIISGIQPSLNTTVSSNNNFSFPTTLTLSVKAKNPNIARCISSVKFFDNGTEITGLTISTQSSNFDSVTYVAAWSGATIGSHNITAVVYDAPNWQYGSNATAISVQGPLPLQLLSFSGSVTNCTASLKWITTNEVNVERYEVESSSNGTDFITVNAVVAKCNNSQIQCTYQSEVGHLNATYYRLKMIDKDGTFSYSQVVYLAASCETKNAIQLYPNPVLNNKTTLSIFTTLSVQNATLVIDNVLGKKVLVQQLKLNKGANYFTINTSQLSNGLYYLKVIAAGNLLPNSIKLVINK